MMSWRIVSCKMAATAVLIVASGLLMGYCPKCENTRRVIYSYYTWHKNPEKKDPTYSGEYSWKFKPNKAHWAKLPRYKEEPPPHQSFHHGLREIDVATLSPDYQPPPPNRNVPYDPIQEIKGRLNAYDIAATDDDNLLVYRIRDALSSNSRLPLNAKSVRLIVDDGDVTVVGAVTSRADKERLNGIINEFPEVVKINNNVEIIPTTPRRHNRRVLGG